ncbi:MAG: S8 family serine peptidase [Chloroflexi bacterium]|nr:S8 family serine peptidase [Chloroflexota bacterium]OJV93254.1 MAG: hypothetical protein BGO39_14935 [Chloroflexi bacterium 54-19]
MPATPASSGQIRRFFAAKSKLNAFATSSILLVTLVFSSLILSACGPNPTDTPPPTPTASSNLKIDSVLLNIYLTYQTTQGSADDKKNAAIQYARNQGAINSKDEAVFEVVLDTPDREQPIKDKIKSMGGIVRNSENMAGTVKMQVAVPVSVFIDYTNGNNKENFLQDLAAFQGVKSIDLIIGKVPLDLRGMPETEEALAQLAQVSKNEGVKLMGADKWQAAGFKGKGVKIGIIDGGFKYHEKFLGSTLPADLDPVDIDAQNGGPGVIDETVHGTAVIEIIYSLAPEASYAAAAVDGSDGEIKQALDYLVKDQKVNIVSVSMGGHGGPGDGTDPLDQYIAQLKKDYGVTFLFSAGNEGASHYTDFFNPDGDGFQQFIPGVTKMAVGNPGSTPYDTFVILSWEQWDLDKKQTNDLDLFIVDQNGKAITSSQNTQSARDPFEAVRIKIPAKTLYYIRVRQKPNTTPYSKPFRMHVFTHDLPLQFIVPEMAVASPASSKGVLAVGAVQWDEDRIAYYSSEGPLPDGTFKPEISAPAGVSSRAYQEDGEQVFDGTSAACPEAAGIATILKGANPNLTADQMDQLMKELGKDLSPNGPDFANGYGRLDLGRLTPSNTVAPKGQLPPVQEVDMSTLHFPVAVLSRFYPAPKPGTPVASKVAPAPLPTLTTSLENGATDFASPGFSGSGKPPAPTSTPSSGPIKTTPPAVTTTPGGNSPGATPQPTTPNETLPPIANASFKDDFKDPTSGLPNKDNTTYQNGTYHLKAANGQLNWGAYPVSQLSVGDFSAEVEVKGISDKNGIYGLVFWQQDANNYYLLSVSGAGQYQVSQFASGSYKEIIGWTTTTGWKPGATNTMRVVASQGAVIVSINDQPGKAGQATGNGAIGFAAGSYANPVDASFSSFRLSSGS